jgi:hypothetical protein
LRLPCPADAYSFDHGTPAPLRLFPKNHTVKKSKDLGWGTVNNGGLLKAAEEAALEILLTTDQSIRYRQDLAGRTIAMWCSPFRDGRSCDYSLKHSWPT